MNSVISLTSLTPCPPRRTVLTEAKNVSCGYLKAISTRLNHARTFLFWATAVTGTSASLLTVTTKWIQLIVEIFTKQKSVKTFGKKDFVFMVFVANFYTPNAPNLQVERIQPNTWRIRSRAIWIIQQNRGFFVCCEKASSFYWYLLFIFLWILVEM